MQTNISTAQRQWYTRPEDERFTSLQDMHADALRDRQESIERSISVTDFRARLTASGAIGVAGQKHTAGLTHYAFSQLATIAKAPAGYMRSLPAELALQCLTYGLDTVRAAGVREVHKLYLRVPRDEQGQPQPEHMTAKAITSGDYARIYDHELIERLIQIQARDPRWHLPTDWNQRPSGAFRGDRDMFALMVDGGSIVEDPTISTSSSSDPNARAMFRGLILRNSEVGHCALTLQTFQFRYVCGNLCIWGAEDVKTLRRRHVGQSYSLMSRVHDGLSLARRFADRPASMDEQAIARLAQVELGKDRESVIKAGQDAGLSAPVARVSYELAETHEQNPRSVWGYAQGITRASQTETDGHQDDRLAIDRIAGALLTKYTAKVYA